MLITIIISFLIGIFQGSCIIYFWQRKMRTEELKKVARMTNDILCNRRLIISEPGEELLLAKIEHQLVRIQETSDGRRKDAEKSKDEIQKLISEIAHQMRTPLTNIENYTEFLRGISDLDADNQRNRNQYLSALQDSEQKLHFLVESFVKMARLEQNIIQIRKEGYNLLNTIQNAFGQIQKKAEEKNIQFHIDLPKQAICIHDTNWMSEALYNLLDNAVKYSDSGNRVDVLLKQNEMYYKFQIRDYGIGINAGEENKIFQRFYRGKRVNGYEGYGIGLYLSRKIVLLHGGFIIAKRMNPGLMIEVSFPV